MGEVELSEGMGSGATRRGFVAGAAAGAALRVLPFASPALARKAPTRCVARGPGVRRNALAVSRDGRTVWTADTGAATITAHHKRDLSPRLSIAVGDAPTGIVLTPGGTRALVTGGFYGEPGLAIVDLRARKVVERLDVGATPGAIAISRDGRRACVASGGAKGQLALIDVRRGRVLSRIDVGRHPRGLAITAAGDHVLVALNGDAAVAVVSLRKREVTRRIPTDPFPYLVAASTRSDCAFVSHNGFGARQVTRLDDGTPPSRARITVGADPSGLAFGPGGTLLVTARGSGTVTIFDARTGRRRKRVRTAGRPRALVVHGRRAYTADEETGQLRGIRL